MENHAPEPGRWHEASFLLEKGNQRNDVGGLLRLEKGGKKKKKGKRKSAIPLRARSAKEERKATASLSSYEGKKEEAVAAASRGGGPSKGWTRSPLYEESKEGDTRITTEKKGEEKRRSTFAYAPLRREDSRDSLTDKG